MGSKSKRNIIYNIRLFFFHFNIQAVDTQKRDFSQKIFLPLPISDSIKHVVVDEGDK